MMNESEKWILIVDDETAILSVLEKSIQKLGTHYQVMTAENGAEALDYLSKRHFDLVVTDYKMVGMSGLDLLEAIREISPDTRAIMMTAYGNDELEADAYRLQAFRYLTKPLEIGAFRKIVQESLSEMAISRPGMLILSDERYRQILKLLENLKRDVGARCVFLTNSDGNFIAQTGDVEKLPLEQVATLLGGSIATLFEAGRIIDNDSESINLAYREGKHENLYAINVGPRLMLILIIDQSAYSSRLGSVWFYAQQTVCALQQKLGETEHASPQYVFNDEIEDALASELNNLFDFDDSQPDFDAQDEPVSEPVIEQAPQPTHPPVEPENNPQPSISKKREAFISWEDAIASGILPGNFSTKENSKTGSQQ